LCYDLLIMEVKDIEKLAKLARIELTEGEKKSYLKEIDAILSYVDQIKGVTEKISDETPRISPLRLTADLITPRTFLGVSNGQLRNVMREDETKNESGENTEMIVQEFPQQENNYLKVKKIL